MSIKILVLDPVQISRQGLVALLSALPDVQVVGASAGGHDLLHWPHAARPDMVVMDDQRADALSNDFVAQARRRFPGLGVVLLTHHRTGDHVRNSLRSGIDAYVVKCGGIEALHAAVRSVAMGNKFLSPEVSSVVVEGFLSPASAKASATALDQLTVRERSVLQLIAEGRTNRSAASHLNLSPKTVEKHRASMMRKLELSTVTDLTILAINLGLIERPRSLTQLIDPGAFPAVIDARRRPPLAAQYDEPEPRS